MSIQFNYRGEMDTTLTPFILGIPADLPLPAAVRPLVDAYDDAFEKYDQALIAAESTRHDLTGAADRDRDALLKALDAGKGDPGAKHEQAAQRAAHVADVQLRQAARQVTATAEAVTAALNESRVEALRLAIEMDRARIEHVAGIWEQIEALVKQATGAESRSVGTATSWLLEILGDARRVEGRVPDVALPHPWERSNDAATTMLDNLEAEIGAPVQ